MKKKIADIDSLRRERDALRLQVKEKEVALKATGEQIKENAGSILWSLINPFSKEKLPSTLKKTAVPLASVLLAGPAGGAKGMLVSAAKTIALNYGPQWLGKLISRKKKPKDTDAGKA